MFSFRYFMSGILISGMAAGLAGCSKTNPVSPVAPKPPVISQTLVDNFEDNAAQNKLGGPWFVFADTSGTRISPAASTTTPIAMYNQGSPLSPLFSFRFLGVFATPATGRVIFAGFGCTLNPASTPVDLSRFRGIQFYARSGGGTGVKFILKRHAITANNSDFQTTVSLTPDWQLIQINFSDLKQPPAASPISFSATDIDSLQWLPAAGVSQFDFQIDDVSFYGYN